MKNKRRDWRKLSIFQTTCIGLSAILIVVIIIQIGIIIHIKNKIDSLKEKNSEITASYFYCAETPNNWQKHYSKQIDPPLASIKAN